MNRALRKAGWVATGLCALAITGWAVYPMPAHSHTAVTACSDVAQVYAGLTGSQKPPPGVIEDLVHLAPNVTDSGLVGAFRAFSQSYSADNVAQGLRAIEDMDASCAAAGLEH